MGHWNEQGVKGFMHKSARTVVFILMLWLVSLPPMVRADFQDELEYHVIETDHEGQIVPWYSSYHGKAYDHNIRLVWDFWKNMKTCPNGVKYYLQHRYWKKNENTRGLGADQVGMTLSSWNLLYQYLGDSAVQDNMIYMADHYIAHSLSRPTDLWPNVPYPYNIEVHSGVYDGDRQGGKNVFQPDKAALFAAELVDLYKITGARKYLDTSKMIANTLAGKITVGDGENSPWPYRVNTRKGKVHTVVKDGVVHRASYTTSWTGALRLFDDLTELDEGMVADYQKARRILVEWIKAYPIKTNRWGPFFEDIPTEVYSDTEINADTMAAYILEHPDWDPDWRQQAEGILNWSVNTFGNQEWKQYGVVPINEQTAFMVPGNSHSARHASVELLLSEKTGDQSRNAGAIRRLNWATYTVNEEGKNSYPGFHHIWLTDGYGDYVRHYLRAMAALPRLAPFRQNHLLRTSSVIKSIDYQPDKITYTKFDELSQERFKLGAWIPGSIEGGEMDWNANIRVLTVSATSKVVTIFKGAGEA